MNRCGHCIDFKPTWEQLKHSFQQKGIKYNEYEASKDSDVISKDNIFGFPTIRISHNGKSIDYNGERSQEAILAKIESLQQSGGGEIDYKYKAYKYWMKYENEKRKMGMIA